MMGVLLSFYPTIISRFKNIQTDTGDTRLNNYFLEHSFQVFFRSGYSGNLWSPTFFFPYEEVLAFSDNLFGSAPVYYFFRTFLNPYSSFQIWMIAVSILNFLAFLFLMKKLEVNSPFSSFASFLFAFGMPRVIKIGHQQLLPQFFTPIAFLILWEFIKKPSNIKLVSLLFLTYLQLLAGIYLGWFWLLSLIIFFMIILIINSEAKFQLLEYWNKNKKVVFGIITGWLLLNFCTFLPYIKAKLVFGSRSYEEVDTMIPRFSSWISPPEGSFWNILLGDFSKNLPMLGEHHLFIGCTTIILTLISLYIYFKKRCLFNPEKLLLVKVCFLVFFVIFILSLRFPFNFSFWRIIYAVFPGASVIRAVSRIWTIAYFYLFIATFVSIDIFWKSLSIKVKWRNLILTTILLFGVAEQYISRLPSYEKEPIMSQVHEIQRLIQSDNKCDMAYFIPKINQENKFWDGINGNLSAMWAGIESNIPVINGYSGNLPPAYHLNSFEDVSLISVINWFRDSKRQVQGQLCIIMPEQAEFKSNFFIKNSNQENLIKKSESLNGFTTYIVSVPTHKLYGQKIRLVSLGDNLRVINQTVEAVVIIENISEFTWSPTSPNPVRFSYRWFDENNHLAKLKDDGIRTELPKDIAPNKKIALLVTIQTPAKAGKYKLVLTMVEEGVTWFNDKESNPTQLSFDITAP